MTQADKLVSWALKQLGTAENPAGSNNVRYNTLFYGREVSGSAYPWCVAFLWAGFQECGMSSLFYGGQKTAGCWQLMQYAKDNGLWVTGNYRKGDLFLYGSSGVPTHAGIYTGEHAGGRYAAIEGNYSNKVSRVMRNASEIIGAYRPLWEGSETGSVIVTPAETCTVTLQLLLMSSIGTQVKNLQILLNAKGYACGTADGIFGVRTRAAVMAFQKANKLESDGEVGAMTWRALLA